MQSQYSDAEQYNFYLSKFSQLGFTADQIDGFFIKDPTFNLSYFIFCNLNFLNQKGFTIQNIVDIAQFGGFEIFNHLMLFINPLLTFEYTPQMLVNIVKSGDVADLLLKLIYEEHHSLKVKGFSNTQILEFLTQTAEIMLRPQTDGHANWMMSDTSLTEHGKNIFGL
jgi:hypothetical protein